MPKNHKTEHLIRILEQNPEGLRQYVLATRLRCSQSYIDRLVEKSNSWLVGRGLMIVKNPSGKKGNKAVYKIEKMTPGKKNSNKPKRRTQYIIKKIEPPPFSKAEMEVLAQKIGLSILENQMAWDEGCTTQNLPSDIKTCFPFALRSKIKPSVIKNVLGALGQKKVLELRIDSDSKKARFLPFFLAVSTSGLAVIGFAFNKLPKLDSWEKSGRRFRMIPLCLIQDARSCESHSRHAEKIIRKVTGSIRRKVNISTLLHPPKGNPKLKRAEIRFETDINRIAREICVGNSGFTKFYENGTRLSAQIRNQAEFFLVLSQLCAVGAQVSCLSFLEVSRKIGC